MPWLWEEEADGGWASRPLEGRATVELAADRVATLVAVQGGPRPRWALLDGPDTGTRVNALPVVGLRLLADRDEIVVPEGRRFFVSLETPSRVQPWDGPEDAVCPLCRRPMLPGRPVARCAKCGCFLHQDPDAPEPRPCFVYGPCPVCAHINELGAGPLWHPSEI
jgi:hypothetical protein